MLKTVVLAAIPSAIETTTAAVNPGLLRKVRRAYETSCMTASSVRGRSEDRGILFSSLANRVRSRVSASSDGLFQIGHRNGELYRIHFPLALELHPDAVDRLAREKNVELHLLLAGRGL